MNLPQHVKTYMGIKENRWVINTVGGMVDKIILTAMQVCGVKDPDYNKNIRSDDAKSVDKAWGRNKTNP